MILVTSSQCSLFLSVNSSVFTLADTETELVSYKNGLYRIVWRYSNCSDTQNNANSIDFCTHFIGTGLGLRYRE